MCDLESAVTSDVFIKSSSSLSLDLSLINCSILIFKSPTSSSIASLSADNTWLLSAADSSSLIISDSAASTMLLSLPSDGCLATDTCLSSSWQPSRDSVTSPHDVLQHTQNNGWLVECLTSDVTHSWPSYSTGPRPQTPSIRGSNQSMRYFSLVKSAWLTVVICERMRGMTGGPIFVAGFCMHCSRYRDDCSFSSCAM